jgi:hypothetical protein
MSLTSKPVDFASLLNIIYQDHLNKTSIKLPSLEEGGIKISI